MSNEVVHPHRCPFCHSTDLTRVSEFTGRFEQRLDRIINYYGGARGLRAAVATNAPEVETQYGVKTVLIRCDRCGYENGNISRFAEVRDA